MNEIKPTKIAQLNIKSERAYQLAVELSELTKENLTAAVTAAIEERLEREKRKLTREEGIARIMEHARAYAAVAQIDPRSPDEIIGYDENGLPT